MLIQWQLCTLQLGGCLGEITKLGPLARTADLCTWVKGLLDKLITHLGLGSSMEEPWGLFALLLLGGSVSSLGASSTCLGSSAVLLGSLECPKPSWAPVASAWTVTCLLVVVSGGSSSCFLEIRIASCLGSGAIRGGKAWEISLSSWGIALCAWEALSIIEHLAAWGEATFTRETPLSPPNQPQVYRPLPHQTSITYWEMRRPAANQAQVCRALLHQTSITYWEMRRPSPANWPQVYRAILHQTSRTYWEIHTYPVQMDPPNRAQVYRALLHQRGPPVLIEPKCTVTYYTKPV